MSTTERPRNVEEACRLGEDVYHRRVRPALRPEDNGKFVAVDIETGDYEIDDDDYTAVQKLHNRKPSAEIWLGRVGEPVAYKMRTGR